MPATVCSTSRDAGSRSCSFFQKASAASYSSASIQMPVMSLRILVSWVLGEPPRELHRGLVGQRLVLRRVDARLEHAAVGDAEVVVGLLELRGLGDRRLEVRRRLVVVLLAVLGVALLHRAPRRQLVAAAEDERERHQDRRRHTRRK
jgi:hypothetical protein